MMSELSEVLITVLTTLSACGGIGGLVFWQHNKKMRLLEAQLAEANVNKAKIEGKADEWNIIKEQNESLSVMNQHLIERNDRLVKMNAEKEDRYQDDKKEMEERFNNQTLFLRNVQRDFVAALEREKGHIKREALLERRIAYLITWICKKGDCDHGEPPRDRLSGKRFDENAAQETEKENETTIKLIEHA